MKNIHVLPTDKPSKLFYNVGGALLFTNYENHNGVNIYITSDEEIKEGDWYYYFGYIVKYNSDENTLTPNCKKIILTTDQDLIKDGVQSINNEFLEWFVKNPSCEEVEVVKDRVFKLDEFNQREFYNQYKIIIPKEEPKQLNSEDFGLPKIGTKEFNDLASGLFGGNPRFKEEAKQETLEEFIKKAYLSRLEDCLSVDFEDGVKLGVKYQAERMYSEEEVMNILYKHTGYLFGENKHLLLEDWFEQFKKK